MQHLAEREGERVKEDRLMERASLCAMRAYGAGENDIGNTLADCRAMLFAADKLADEVERRLNDLGGYDGRFPVRQALDEYRKLQKEKQDG
jgi:hypothetical protein